MKKYFLNDGYQQTGPFNIEELKSKNLNSDTPIWFEGLDEWTTIGKVDELKKIIIVTPPPIQKFTPQTKFSADLPKQNNSTGRKLLVWGGIVVLGLIGYLAYNQIKHQQYQNHRQNIINAEEDVKAMIRKNITSYVTAERSDYRYSELGGIYNLNISVTNSSNYLIDNVKVRVIYIKANGDVWDSKTVDFYLLNPQTKKTIKVPDTERGIRVKYEIISIKSVALGLN